MDTIPRHLADTLAAALRTSRVINIVGPRQSGKTTLVRDLIPTSYFLDLDDESLLASLALDSYGLLDSLAKKVEADLPIAIDEVQRLPQITLALKRIVDRNRHPGQFILTGSSNIFSASKALDSLAGRVSTLTLRPLSAAEIMRAAPCRLLDMAADGVAPDLKRFPTPAKFQRADVIDVLVRGGFPEIRPLNDRDRIARYHSYINSIVERDIAPIAAIRRPDTLRRLINQLAHRTAEELNVSSLCAALGAHKGTVDTYIDALTRLGIVHRLGAWTASGARKEVRTPKLHFMDSGCATALRGEDAASFDLGADPIALGHVLESFVFCELEKSLPFLNRHWELYHWRFAPREIDIVAQAPGKTLALFEIKASTSVSADDFRHMDWFLKNGPGKSCKGSGFVIYLGDQLLSFGSNLLAVPLSIFWSFPHGQPS
ncbi:MAG: ATP-binding protein [Methylobacillus sp.]|jgi:predicted AAA+ superfamily ATPase|nr:ATP-binding protein [Methylobacillus sp.]